MTLEEISETIHMRRRRLKMTQAEVADRAGVHPMTISKLERGVLNVSFETLVGIIGVLGGDVSIDWSQAESREADAA